MSGTTKDGTNRVEFRELYLRIEEDTYEYKVLVRYKQRWGWTKWMEVRSELVEWEIPG